MSNHDWFYTGTKNVVCECCKSARAIATRDDGLNACVRCVNITKDVMKNTLGDLLKAKGQSLR